MTIPTGRFVWFDYVAKDIAKAQGYFGELFNWKTQEVPAPGGSYSMIAIGDQTIGGYTPTPKGAPETAHWLASLQVADANATAKQVKALGGKVLKDPDKMGDFGTFAIVADPLGGVFSLWQPVQAQGSGDFKELVGSFCWNELYTTDPEASIAFYSKLAGFTEEKMQMGDSTYHILNFDGKGRAGVTKPPAPMPQAWMPYVHVASTDQTIAKAKKLGSNVHVAGEDIPNVGRIGIFSDPQGGMLGVLQPSPTMTK